MTLEEIVSELIDTREGIEFTDDPDDAGGPTKFGITQKTLSKYRGYKVTRKEVAELERPEAEAILREMYARRFASIEYEPLRILMVDWHVHGGGPINHLQRVLRLDDDGIIGPKTLRAIEMADPHWLTTRIWQERLRYLGRITRDRPKNVKYIYGWINRMIRLFPNCPKPGVEPVVPR